MRAILILLILLNAAYLAWNLIQPPAGAVSITSNFESTLPGITLVSERQATTSFCVSVGDFLSLEDAERFVAAATGLGLEAELLASSPDMPSQYQVFLAPAPTREAAAETLESLRSRALQADIALESYLITRGELENAVALGLFSDPANAEGLAERVRQLGFEVGISEVPGARSPIRVEVKNLQNERLGAAVWSQLTLDRPYLTQSENVCQTIAPGQ